MREEISVTTDAVVFYKSNSGISVLLIKRKNQPFKDSWALPGGFLEPEETLKKACERELKEETGLKIKNWTQIGVYDKVDRDPRKRIISIAFACLLTQRPIAKAADDAKEVSWEILPIRQDFSLAFDHQQIIEDAMLKLNIKNEISHT
ncbi:NUDIX hydrolase [Mesonia sp. HuA40]|uniref:NUDIX domain-containing protein n=1 Tax=Mesonia sp. HuA40 TaxID=2602761 RepID=UPI0011C894F5|nr:NUDIX hydrolase [Mesonia sp. HuA40]TXK70956.1 NUDIX hydrolase [Mesonia sp. HuA40]